MHKLTPHSLKDDADGADDVGGDDGDGGGDAKFDTSLVKR